MNRLLKHIVISGVLMALTIGILFAQKSKKKTTRIQVEYLKDAWKDEFLIATLRVREERYVPLNNTEVNFFSVSDTAKVLLGKVLTNDEGKAVYVLEDDPRIIKDSSGVMTFEVVYAGSTSNGSADRRISVKQADLEISFFQKDSIKSIDMNLSEIGPEGQMSPVSGQDISLYIQGTFSQLNFDEGKTDNNGHLRVSFPVHMPGDTAGVLAIVAKILEDDTYGTIETKGEINWGIPVPLAIEKRRGLGDTDAPLWMVYTLIILLSAVWFHYLYVIILIIKIKLARKARKYKLPKQKKVLLADLE